MSYRTTVLLQNFSNRHANSEETPKKIESVGFHHITHNYCQIFIQNCV
jgi:hypothetical protein